MPFPILFALLLGAAHPQAPAAPLPALPCENECWLDRPGPAMKVEPRPRSLEGLLGDTHRLRNSRIQLDIEASKLPELELRYEACSGLDFACSEALSNVLNADGDWKFGFVNTGKTVSLPWLLRFMHNCNTRMHWELSDGRVTFLTETEAREQQARTTGGQRGKDLAAARARVRVHWDVVQLHGMPVSAEATPLKHRLLLRGRLGYVDDEGVELPLSFALRIGVCIARRPETAPDWSVRSSPEFTYLRWTDAADGAFQAHVDVREVERVPGELASFQAGLCLPDFDTSASSLVVERVLPQSIARLEIPGPPVLREELAWINACGAVDRTHYDAAAMVRALNGLRTLGKQRALEVLAEYATLVESDGEFAGPARPDSLDHGNATAVCWLVRLLFDFPPQARAEIARYGRYGLSTLQLNALGGIYLPDLGCFDGAPAYAATYPGNQYPFVVVDDFPFLAPQGSSYGGGSREATRQAIDWARKYGTLRERELVPPDDPVTLAESLETRVGALPAGNDPLEQARRAVGVLGLVHWDRGAQRYAAGPRRN